MIGRTGAIRPRSGEVEECRRRWPWRCRAASAGRHGDARHLFRLDGGGDRLAGTPGRLTGWALVAQARRARRNSPSGGLAAGAPAARSWTSNQPTASAVQSRRPSGRDARGSSARTGATGPPGPRRRSEKSGAAEERSRRGTFPSPLRFAAMPAARFSARPRRGVNANGATDRQPRASAPARRACQ